jgi:hypothetical protein
MGNGLQKKKAKQTTEFFGNELIVGCRGEGIERIPCNLDFSAVPILTKIESL